MITETLRVLGACRPAIKWATRFEEERPSATLADAWAACPRGSWLLWVLFQIRALEDADEIREIQTNAARAWALSSATKRDGAGSADAVRAAVAADWPKLAAAWTRLEAAS